MVITAAHCFIDKGEQEAREPTQLYFIAGKIDLTNFNDKNFQFLQISNIFIHPDWDAMLTSYDGDIAVVLLQTMILFNKNVQPICLPVENDSLDLYKKGSVAGWGLTENETQSNVLKIVQLRVVPKRTCLDSDNLFSFVMSSKNFCTEFSNKGPCKGENST